ncbi:MAG: Fe-S cluster assembly sulfur transfer protein SufU [Gemmataceae bacterium]
MPANNELYEDLIKDHSKSPRNFRILEAPDCQVEGRNPLCGDHFTVYLKINGEKIEDISFQGDGCAISKSSASIMTQLLKGKTRQEAEALFSTFHNLVTSSPDEEIDEETLGKMAVFAGVRKFPVRVKCATLAWHSVHNALEGHSNTVSTEESPLGQ